MPENRRAAMANLNGTQRVSMREQGVDTAEIED